MMCSKTYHINPSINKTIGLCKKSLDNTILNLEQRKVTTSVNERGCLKEETKNVHAVQKKMSS